MSVAPESVDEKSLSLAMSRKTIKKKESGHKLVKEIFFLYFFNLFAPSVLNIGSTFDQNFNFNLRRDPNKKKKTLRASRL